MPKKILITGASGFIGSFLVEEALARGLEVYGGIRKSSSKLFLRQPGVSFFEMDLSAPKELSIRMKEFFQTNDSFDYVVHCAGITSARRKVDFDKINFEGTKNLVNALLESGMELKKFLLISSLATFGPGDANACKAIEVTDQERPISAYARSKQKAEQFLKSFEKFPFIILKPTAVFGPRDRDFLMLFRSIARGFEISTGKNPQMISLIHARDLAHATISLLELPNASRTYIISDGMKYSKDELNAAVRKSLGKKAMRITIPFFIAKLIVKANEQVHLLTGKLPFLHSEKFAEISAANWMCNSQPVWEAIGEHPTYTLRQAIDETAAWYKRNGWL